jgi:enoyl-CoA hydratase
LGVALEILMTGRFVAAEEALRIGLLHRIVEGDRIEAAVEFARAFSGNGLLALRLVRDAAIRGMDTTLQEGLRIEADLSTLSMRSDDGREGPRAFLEKRPAAFKDR